MKSFKITHNDIKPANILIKNDNLLLADLGEGNYFN